MLINTVILFLNDLLPIFILFCLLKANNAKVFVSKWEISLIMLMSMFGIMATFRYLPSMSEWWSGTGIEVIQSTELLFVYFCLIFSSSSLFATQSLSAIQRYLISSAVVIFIVLNASAFLVFLDSYIASGDSIQHIIAGLAIGLGVCLSFSFLIYFLFVWLKKKQYTLVTYSFWALFLTGQVSQIINLLQQVDIIQSSEALWDSSVLVEDRSEYGHLLNTLFGYKARPSFEFIMVYLGSLLIIYSYFFIALRHKFNQSKDSEGRDYEL